MDAPVPKKIALTPEQALLIEWSDGIVQQLSVAALRKHCPCATCREQREAPAPATGLLPILNAAEAQPLRLFEMRPLGHYAYGLHFSDGHDSGIYTLEYLRGLGQ